MNDDDKYGRLLLVLAILPVLAYLFLGFAFSLWWQAAPIFSLSPMPYLVRGIYRRLKDN
jgi:hypothetical protein